MTGRDTQTRGPQDPSRELEAYADGFLPPPDFAQADRGTHPYFEKRDLGQPPEQPAWDWRDTQVISTPGSQGACSACSSFAVAAAIEAARRIADRNDVSEVDVGFLHTCVAHRGTVADAGDDCRRGADAVRVLEEVARSGYALKTAQSRYPTTANQCGRPVRERGLQYELLSGPNAAKAAILQAPIITEMYYWTNFLDAHKGKDVYHPDITGRRWGHTVCIVGFSASGWIIKNSQGPAWGVGGFATLLYDTCGVFSDPPPDCYPTQSFAITI